MFTYENYHMASEATRFVQPRKKHCMSPSAMCTGMEKLERAQLPAALDRYCIHLRSFAGIGGQHFLGCIVVPLDTPQHNLSVEME